MIIYIIYIYIIILYVFFPIGFSMVNFHQFLRTKRPRLDRLACCELGKSLGGTLGTLSGTGPDWARGKKARLLLETETILYIYI